MAKVKCNHCKCKYSYTSSKGVSNLMEEVKLTTKLDIVELDRKFYCKGCRQNFIEHLIDTVFIIERAKQIGMDFPESIVVSNSISIGFMKFLEKLKLAKKVKK